MLRGDSTGVGPRHHGRVTPPPTPERFRALARSSPWRWHTVRIRVRWNGPSTPWPASVRAWVRRPDGLRVETLDGRLVHASTRPLSWGDSRSLLLGLRGKRTAVVDPRAPLDPAAPRPEFDAEGFVSLRPTDDGGIRYDDPMFQNYQWVAMLDPVELADGDRHHGPSALPPIEIIDDVRDVDHHGRPAWEAVVAPTGSYQPRCPCCALLFSAALFESGVADEDWLAPGFEFPDAFRVRLDVSTGVCALVEELGGARSGAGHDLAVEAVDESMPDPMFLSK